MQHEDASRPAAGPSADGEELGWSVARRARAARAELARSASQRILTGAAGGVAESLRVEPMLIRVALCVLALAGGAGALMYVLLLAVMGSPDPSREVPEARHGMRPVAAIALITFGLLLLLREWGLWFGDALVWPAALAGLGATVLWARGAGAEGSRRVRGAASANPVEAVFAGRVSIWRIALGALLIIGGMAVFLAANSDLYLGRASALPALWLRGAVPILVTIAGALLIFGPWVGRLAGQLSEERRERIRSEERSEMAAHLHDSVLQTLALIQRADSERRMSSLARVQERELRAWLYGQTGTLEGSDTLAAAIDTAAGRVEAMHEVEVDVVVVGDAPLDDRLRALAGACGEAMSNAAQHSGAGRVSVYVEAEPAVVTVYIRDQGRGFDAASVPPDRRGIADSIKGRVERHGGWTRIVSEPGNGTEVQIVVPRKP